MEGSRYSPKNDRAAQSSQESGWTMYFDDLFSSGENTREASNGPYGASSSLISDAASKISKDSDVLSTAPPGKSSKKLISYKKRRTKTVFMDDEAMEDTATSPLSSPKISDFINIKSCKKVESIDTYDQEENGVGKSSGLETGRSEFGYGDRENECTELKKKGLCLVPLSTFTNYLT